MSKDLNLKLQKIQSELKAPKSQFNQFGGYHYRNAEDILEAVKPILNKYEVTIILNDEVVTIGNRFYVKATATLSDGENKISTNAYAREELERKKYDVSQLTGSASTYARKYALNGLLLIDDTRDADSTNNKDNEENSVKLKTYLEGAVMNINNLNDISSLRNDKEFVECLNKVDNNFKQTIISNIKGLEDKFKQQASN